MLDSSGNYWHDVTVFLQWHCSRPYNLKRLVSFNSEYILTFVDPMKFPRVTRTGHNYARKSGGWTMATFSSHLYSGRYLIGLQAQECTWYLFSPTSCFRLSRLPSHQASIKTIQTSRTRHLHFHPNHQIFCPLYLRNSVAYLVPSSTRAIEDDYLATQTAQRWIAGPRR